MKTEVQKNKNSLFDTAPLNIDLAALVVRLVFGGFIVLGHGWFKVQLWLDGRASTFFNSLGLNTEFELFLAIFSEVICGIAVLIGFQTRLAAIPLILTMFVATIGYHWDDAFFYLPKFSSNKEFALVYATGFVLIYLLGAGKYSIDFLLQKNKLKNG